MHMNYIYSTHISHRISERKITHKQIESILNKDVPVLTCSSEQDADVDLHYGKVNGVYILVVVNRKTNVLVTTRHMRKKEKQLYEEITYEQN